MTSTQAFVTLRGKPKTSALVEFAAALPAAAIPAAGSGVTGAQLDARTSPSVMDTAFAGGAVGNGTTDDTAAFQAAQGSKKPVFVPPNLPFKLSTPVTVDNETVFFGANGHTFGSGSIPASIIKPTTIAFKSSDPTSQLQGLRFQDLAFVGGTRQLDLGQFHLVTVERCAFTDFSKNGISLVRGEKHCFRDLIFYNQNVAGEKCMALASVTDTDFDYIGVGKQYRTWYNSGSPNYIDITNSPWVDRFVLDNVTFNYSAQKYDWGIFCDGTLSNMGAKNVYFHGAKQGGISAQIIQLAVLENWLYDQCGTSGAHADCGFKIGTQLNGVYCNNVSPGFAQNSFYNTALISVANNFRTVWVNCNFQKFSQAPTGYLVGDAQGTAGLTFVRCDGDLTHSVANANKKRLTGIIGDGITSDGGFSTSLSTQQGADHHFTSMSDTNGASDSPFGIRGTRCVGGSGFLDYFRVADKMTFSSKSGVDPVFEMQSNETTLATWTVGSGSPEGVVTAPVGSLRSRTDGGATTSLYVKTSGTGNTGWTAK